MKNDFIYRCCLAFDVRGSPSLVGRGIANPMSEMIRGFKSHSPRFFLKIKTLAKIIFEKNSGCNKTGSNNREYLVLIKHSEDWDL